MDKIDKVENFIEKGKTFLGKGLTCDDPDFEAWNNSLIRFIEKQYGKDSTTTEEFKNRAYSLRAFSLNTPNEEFVRAFDKDLHTTLADLQYILEELEDDPVPAQSTHSLKTNHYNKPEIVINNNNATNNNIINNTNNILDVKKIIQDNSMLSDKDKEELIQKLDALEQLQKSNKTKNEKWKIAKEILKFIIDKGADIAIMFLPQILKALQ